MKTTRIVQEEPNNSSVIATLDLTEDLGIQGESIRVMVRRHHGHYSDSNYIIGLTEKDELPTVGSVFRIHYHILNGKPEHSWCGFGLVKSVKKGDDNWVFHTDDGTFRLDILNSS